LRKNQLEIPQIHVHLITFIQKQKLGLADNFIRNEFTDIPPHLHLEVISELLDSSSSTIDEICKKNQIALKSLKASFQTQSMEKSQLNKQILNETKMQDPSSKLLNIPLVQIVNNANTVNRDHFAQPSKKLNDNIKLDIQKKLNQTKLVELDRKLQELNAEISSIKSFLVKTRKLGGLSNLGSDREGRGFWLFSPLPITKPLTIDSPEFAVILVDKNFMRHETSDTPEESFLIVSEYSQLESLFSGYDKNNSYEEKFIGILRWLCRAINIEDKSIFEKSVARFKEYTEILKEHEICAPNNSFKEYFGKMIKKKLLEMGRRCGYPLKITNYIKMMDYGPAPTYVDAIKGWFHSNQINGLTALSVKALDDVKNFSQLYRWCDIQLHEYRNAKHELVPIIRHSMRHHDAISCSSVSLDSDSDNDADGTLSKMSNVPKPLIQSIFGVSDSDDIDELGSEYKKFLSPEKNETRNRDEMVSEHEQGVDELTSSNQNNPKEVANDIRELNSNINTTMQDSLNVSVQDPETSCSTDSVVSADELTHSHPQFNSYKPLGKKMHNGIPLPNTRVWVEVPGIQTLK
jgi:hypothetical protein